MASSGESKKEDQPPNFTIKHVDVGDEGKGTDSVSLAASVLTGYTLLSGSFNVTQANLAEKFNLKKNIKQLVINNYQIVNGNVCGDVIQANNSEVNFSQQVTDAF